MWIQVTDETAIQKLMVTVHGFHDSCLKEMKYKSGAYVDNELCMNPTNTERTLNVIIQCQSCENAVIELEFGKIKYLKLFPLDEMHTCEIHDSTLLLSNGFIYWCDCGGLTVSDIGTYNGTVICSETLRWRSTTGPLGYHDYFCKKT